MNALEKTKVLKQFYTFFCKKKYKIKNYIIKIEICKKNQRIRAITTILG
jgi:lantibiotic modifying enzyme|uniref:Uncharacterized protein n=1 Tax=Chlorella vulgaris TaxID=3077 RepID=V9H181_CHLVU|nr:hypothetical protein ChvulCp121 [Chlorella vulgaris]pir/T07308/ hypothetical protein 48e - Chlorella vulgaris chloroplast [Chlorella vulgaris]BAA57956.1 unnamed protein product [Chlorella vulgaris]